MNQTHAHDLESFMDLAVHCLGTTTVSDKTVEHIALLLLLLQKMSRVITVMIHDTHPFWSPERDRSLGLYSLTKPVPDKLLNTARGTDSDDFWMSPDTCATFWPLQIRLMLEGDSTLKDKINPSDFLAMGLRFNTVAPVVRRLLTVLDYVVGCSPTARNNNVIKTLRLQLHAFLRTTRQKHAEDVDPDNNVVRDFHLRQFAGEIGNLHPASQARFRSVVSKLREDAGPEATALVEMAAIKAGLKHARSFREENMSGVSSVSVSTMNDCGGLLLTQLPNLELIKDLFYHLGIRVDEETVLDKVLSDALDNEDTQMDDDGKPAFRRKSALLSV